MRKVLAGWVLLSRPVLAHGHITASVCTRHSPRVHVCLQMSPFDKDHRIQDQPTPV